MIILVAFWVIFEYRVWLVPAFVVQVARLILYGLFYRRSGILVFKSFGVRITAGICSIRVAVLLYGCVERLEPAMV